MTGWAALSVCVEREGKAILTDVSVELKAGTTTAILGPNGSGKTTLLRVLAGLIRPSKGLVGGEGVGSWRELDWAKTVACVLGPVVDDLGFCVEEVLLSSQFPDGGRWLDPTPERRKPLLRLLERLEVFSEGAEAGLHRDYSTLSAGERQLVDVIRGILQPTPVLLLDEPTSALDLRHRLLVRNLLHEESLQRGRAVALCLHDLGEAMDGVDSVIVLQKGRAVAAGPPLEILTAELLARVWGVVPAAGGFRLLANAGDRN